MTEMEIEYIDPKKLKRDVNQPRTVFDDGDISRLAGTYKTFDGIIDPIEVDQDDVIIRGERRWRAAKLAELHKVPIIRKEIKSVAKRLERQTMEGVPHTPMDKAWSYATEIININIPHMTDKELKEMRLERKECNINEVKNIISKCSNRSTLSNVIKIGKKLGKGKKVGIHELSNRIGVSMTNISDHLNLIKLHPDVQKLIGNGTKNKFGISISKELSKLPDEIQIKFVKVIQDKEDFKHDEVVKWRKILQENPESEDLFDKVCKMEKTVREESLQTYYDILEENVTPDAEGNTRIVEFIKAEVERGTMNKYSRKTIRNIIIFKEEPETIRMSNDADSRMLVGYQKAEEEACYIIADHIAHFKNELAKRGSTTVLWNIYNHSKKQLILLGQLADVDESRIVNLKMVE